MVTNGTVQPKTDNTTANFLNSLPAGRDTREQLEDPLAYFPCSTIVEYAKGQLIYGRSQVSNNIYLVIDGKVKVCRTADDGRQVVVDIYQPDEFFGECGFLGEKQRVEEAVALDATKVMTWSTAEIEELVIRRPRLGIALVQLLVRRSMDFGARIESFSIDNIGRRLVRSLVRFSERFGRDTGDGSVEMMPFTHELLSQYVGTSREIVTHYMNQLRRQGYLKYSRKGISLNREALREWLRRDTEHEEA
jgi:CRP/FNR family cyclic AMP-dependent transcriptional regulator